MIRSYKLKSGDLPVDAVWYLKKDMHSRAKSGMEVIVYAIRKDFSHFRGVFMLALVTSKCWKRPNWVSIEWFTVNMKVSK